MDAHNAATRETWDAFAHAHGGCFLQSWDWAAFQESVGRSVRRREIFAADGRKIGQFSAIMNDGPLGLQYLYVPRGPLGVSGASETKIALSVFTDELSASGAAFARVELPFVISENPFADSDFVAAGFVPAKTMQPAVTSIVNLSESEEALLAAMHSKTRYNIRVGERHGVTVREANHDVAAFAALMKETTERDGFSAHAPSYYEAMLAALQEKTHAAGMRVRLFFAEHEGMPVAAALTAEYGDTVTYLHGASASSMRNLMAPFLLHWTVMKEAKAAGFRKYDFWGVAPTDDAEHSWAGITRFKLGFGGARVSYAGAWELPGKGIWYSLYRYLRRIRG